MIQITVKEYLADMDRRHTASLNVIESEVRGMARRIEVLEQDRQRRATLTAGFSKVWVGAIAVLGILVNMPAVLYYLHGGSP